MKRALALACLGVACACSAASSPASYDASTRGGSREAGVDATHAKPWRDGGVDAGHASVREAGRADVLGDARAGGDGGRDGAGKGDGRTSDSAAGGDAGAVPDAPYPGFPFEAPQVTDDGAPVLASPLFVPVVFAGDTLAPQIETFLSALGPSAYWSTIGAEYGVGPAVSGPLVVESAAAPSDIADPAIQTFLANAIATDPRFGALGPATDAGAQPGDPDAAPPASVVYVLFYPTGTTITAGALGTGCVSFGGYHSSFALANGAMVTYAVVPRCASFNGVSGLDFVTVSASHELIEAATDPVPMLPAYRGTDLDHVLWELVLGDGEVADMCAFLPDSNVHPAEPALSAFLVQRSWSDHAAAAGDDPCVPATGEGAYFNSVPAATSVPFVEDGQTYQTLGTQIAVGQTATVTLDLVSNGPTDGPWTVQLLDYGAAYDNPTILDLKVLGASSGENGQTVDVQITPLQPGPAGLFGIAPYFIYSTRGGVSTFWIGAVVN